MVAATDNTGAAAAQNNLQSFVGSKKSDEVSKDQFLQLLVTQLKNQDPLDPMKSEEFAVNLAQFSQLEQLVSINGKLGDKTTDATSLASYLGQEVSINSDKINVDSGSAGELKVDLPTAADDVKVQISNKDGAVVDTLNFKDLPQGKRTLALTGLNATNGQYSVKVTATGASGSFEVKAQPAGIVTGFVPGPDPKLIVNGNEIGLGDVTEVGLAPTPAPNA